MLTEFSGRTAVVTGAASGIGLGLARRCVERGMQVAMLDVEGDALRASADGLDAAEQVLPFRVDTTDPDGMEAVAADVIERFGAVHLLCNNAGVSITGPLWAMTAHDVRWVIDANLVGVCNGIRAFVPRMIARGDEGHVVNTASLAGLTPTPNASLYSATKAAVVALSEALFHDLRDVGANIGVSVLCPGLVSTNIMRSARNRPAELAETGEAPMPEAVHAYFATGERPTNVADRVLRAVERGDFYVLTNEAARESIAARNGAVDALGDPVRPLPGSTTPDPS